MGSFTFKWDKPAEVVYVTGTFDNWNKTAELEKVGDSFEKTVELPEVSEKVFYKFVVDNNWVIDDAAPTEKDAAGIDNNVLTPDQIVKSAVMSSVAPDATTAQLAAGVPLEEKKDAPATTEADKVVEEKKPELSEKTDAAEETVTEKPEEPTADVATPVAPGDFPETAANELDKPAGIKPMPAADNALNPIKLAPGEKIPDSVAAQDVNKNVKLDEESYEKADELPGEVSAVQVPPITDNMIPESSLPISGADDVAISSVAPAATTVALAADAPIETKKEDTPEVPAVVKESQEKAGAEPEASAEPEEVKEKGEVEAELLEKVPEAPSAAEGTSGEGTDKKEGETAVVDAAPAVATVGEASVTAAVAAEDAAVEKVADAAAVLPDSAKVAEKTQEEISPEVPAEVKEDVIEASASPEAAANTEAVAEKEVEAQPAKEAKEVTPAEPNAEESAKVEEAPAPAETKPAEEAPKSEEAPKPKSEESKPAEGATKPADANGTQPPAAEPSTAPSTTATTEKKKKNRLSAFVSKMKQKLKH